MDYITCETRKNSPKINVLVCEKKCKYAKTCKPYQSYLETTPADFSINEFSHGGESLTSIKSPDSNKDSLVAAGK